MFTLSSHHPFKIPEQYKKKFNGADLPLKNSIRYADHALKKFFEKARKASWFENTWFILTADHTSIPQEQFYRKRVGSYRVPIAFYHPKKEGKKKKGIIQHTDIMPSVLHLSNYEGDIIRFGYNVFEEENRYAFGYINNNYHIIDNRYIVGFDGKEVKAIFDYKNDPHLQENLVKKGIQKPKMEKTLKSVIQQFNDRLISNNLVLR
jgi:phosphoglycerol transferase MdoB-like AlkP superfamily enzyme